MLTVASKKAVNNPAPTLDSTPTPAVTSNNLQAHALAITERPSPIKNENGVQVQVKISSQMQQKFDELQKELLQLRAEKSARETEELTSAHLAAKKNSKNNATKATQQLRPPLQTLMMTLLQWRIQHWITHLMRTKVSGAF
jgi:hypothetical protein